jgi:hypothetical protein
MVASWKDETGNGHFVLSTEEKSPLPGAVNEAVEIKDLLATEEKAAGIFDYLNAAAGSVRRRHRRQRRSAPASRARASAEAWLGSDAYGEMKASQFRRLGDAFTIETASATSRRSHRGQGRLLGHGRRDQHPRHRPGPVPRLDRAHPAPGPRPRPLPERDDHRVDPLRHPRDGLHQPCRDGARAHRGQRWPATGGPTDVYGLKPRSDITITPYTWESARSPTSCTSTVNTLDDEPRMRGLLDRDMIDGVKMVEDDSFSTATAPARTSSASPSSRASRPTPALNATTSGPRRSVGP